MSSDTIRTNLWIERSRLAGMVLECVSYGAFSILTVQSLVALMQRPRNGGEITNYRLVLVFYITITFILGTISTAMVGKYTETIWIDLRDSPGGPLALIENSLKYKINILALCCGHIQEWFMQALLLHRCFVIWDWARYVMIPITAGYITMIALSIVVQVESSTGTGFYHINTELAYLCIQVGLNIIYTILVAYRLFAMRSELRHIISQYDSSTYDTVILMAVESTLVYTIFAVVFIIAFALPNQGVSTLCYMSIGKVQGIAQLLIILRVAKGRAVTSGWSTRIAAPTTVVFSHSVLDRTDEAPEQGIVHSRCPAPEKATDASIV